MVSVFHRTGRQTSLHISFKEPQNLLLVLWKPSVSLISCTDYLLNSDSVIRICGSAVTEGLLLCPLKSMGVWHLSTYMSFVPFENLPCICKYLLISLVSQFFWKTICPEKTECTGCMISLEQKVPSRKWHLCGLKTYLFFTSCYLFFL